MINAMFVSPLWMFRLNAAAGDKPINNVKKKVTSRNVIALSLRWPSTSMIYWHQLAGNRYHREISVRCYDAPQRRTTRMTANESATRTDGWHVSSTIFQARRTSLYTASIDARNDPGKSLGGVAVDASICDRLDWLPGSSAILCALVDSCGQSSHIKVSARAFLAADAARM